MKHLRLTRWEFDGLMSDLKAKGFDSLSKSDQAKIEAIDEGAYTVIGAPGDDAGNILEDEDHAPDPFPHISDRETQY